MPIDVHAHYVPPSLIAAVEKAGGALGVKTLPGPAPEQPAIAFHYGFASRPMFAKLVEPAADRIASLDRQGLDRQLVATWPDIYGYGLSAEACTEWHRILNDTLAEWCEANRARFSFVASAPLVDANGAAQELRRVAELGAVAVMVPANIEGTNIGEAPLDPFWGEAEALRLPVIVHPVLVQAAPRAAKFGLTQIAQYTFDTTLGLGSLLLSGVLDRFPNLVLVGSHGGGALPYLVGRFDVMYARMDHAAQAVTATDRPSSYARRVTYDSIVHSPAALRFLIETVGVDQVVLGTDESFPPADRDPLALVRSAGLSAADAAKVVDANARRLFSRLP